VGEEGEEGGKGIEVCGGMDGVVDVVSVVMVMVFTEKPLAVGSRCRVRGVADWLLVASLITAPLVHLCRRCTSQARLVECRNLTINSTGSSGFSSFPALDLLSSLRTVVFFLSSF
jgi:hypothetical protein